MEALVHNGPCDVTVENPYHRITEARERSLAVVTLHSEGRSLKAIARFLSVHKSTVHQILKRCAEKRGDGLEERTYPRSQRPAAARLVALPGLWYAA
jgi:transposase